MSTAATADRRAHLRSIADTYFNGLRAHDLSDVPYDENVLFRTPLSTGGSNVPIRGRSGLLDFFAGIYAALGQVMVIDYFFNDAQTSVCVRAAIELKNGNVLRVADVFRVNTDGKVVEQETTTILDQQLEQQVDEQEERLTRAVHPSSIRTRRSSLPIISSLKALSARRQYRPHTPNLIGCWSSCCLSPGIRCSRPHAAKVRYAPPANLGRVEHAIAACEQQP